VLEVSPSGYYAWRNRAPSEHRQADLVLGDRIETLHRKSRSTYGRPRIQADLRDEGVHASDKRVARLMRERGIKEQVVARVSRPRYAIAMRDRRRIWSSGTLRRPHRISFGSLT
jgi:putative transposase